MAEQQLAGMGVGLGEGTAIRLCIGPQDAGRQPVREGQTEGGCTFTSVSRSGSTWRGHMVCHEPAGEGDFVTSLHSATHYSTQATITSQAHGRMKANTEARRLSADCGAIGRRQQAPRTDRG